MSLYEVTVSLYEVTVKRIEIYFVQVEAGSEEEAEEIADLKVMENPGEYHNYSDTEITAYEAE